MRFLINPSGATAVEFALLSPILMLMMGGIINYGGFFWTSHALQQMANDAARAAISGTTASERRSLAQSVFDAEKADYSLMADGITTLALKEQGPHYTVTLTFVPQAEGHEIFANLPGMPKSVIRTASVARGGY